MIAIWYIWKLLRGLQEACTEKFFFLWDYGCLLKLLWSFLRGYVFGIVTLYALHLYNVVSVMSQKKKPSTKEKEINQVKNGKQCLILKSLFLREINKTLEMRWNHKYIK